MAFGGGSRWARFRQTRPGEWAAPLELFPTDGCDRGGTEAIRLTDLNGDGRDDLLSTCAGEDSALVHVARPDGSLEAPVRLSLSESHDIRTCALDDDPFPDIITVRDEHIRLWQGRGDGTFIVRGGRGVSSGQITRIACGDLDDDDINDVVVAVAQAAHDVCFLKGDGAGQLEAPRCYSAGEGDSAVGVAIGALDGDGAPDVLVSMSDTGSLVSMQGDWDGGLAPVAEIRSGTGWPGASSAHGAWLDDVDGDGRVDAIQAGTGPDGIWIHRGDGEGSFEPGEVWGTWPAPHMAEKVVELPDGRRGLVSGAYSAPEAQDPGYRMVELHALDPGGSVAGPRRLDSTGEPSAVAVADLDSDGLQDILSLHPGAQELRIRLGRPEAPGWEDPLVVRTASLPADVAVADMNGDDIPDVLVISTGDVDISIHHGIGRGAGWALGPARPHQVGVAPLALWVGDLDGGVGGPDLAVLLRNDAFAVLRSDGAGGFGERGVHGLAGRPAAMAVGHVDGDGLLDLVAALDEVDELQVFFGTGDGGFTPPTTVSLGVSCAAPAAIAVMPGRLALGCHGDQALTVLVLTGEREAPVAMRPDRRLRDVAVSMLRVDDVDGDLWQDLIVALDSPAPELRVLFGAEDRSLVDGASLRQAWPLTDLAIAEVDGRWPRELVTAGRVVDVRAGLASPCANE